MVRVELVVNGERHSVQADGDMPLLWVLRDLLGLTGTKYGCGIGACGSCTVLEGEEAVRACQIPLDEAEGRSFTTIEGLSPDGSHPLQQVWIAEDVSQCGYCQPGMLLEVRSLLTRRPRPSEGDLGEALSDHVCRCGSYTRIRNAVQWVSGQGGGR